METVSGLETRESFGTISTVDQELKNMLEAARKAALSEANILITGESGTGKTVLANAIHAASPHRGGPFVSVSLLAIPDTLIESELFGHEKGAFTGAHALKIGSFESGNGGTILLDEIGDIVYAAQGKILQAIDEKCFRRLGSNKVIQFDSRMIATTNRDLLFQIKRNKFREDLYYRLKGFSLHLPPLRERREDIPFLIQHFVDEFGTTCQKPNLKVSKTVLKYLMEYQWPGNVRELKNAVHSAVTLAQQDMLWIEHFPFEVHLQPQIPNQSAADVSVDAILKGHILKLLEQHRWSKRKVAGLLKISRPRLDRYIGKFKLQP